MRCYRIGDPNGRFPIFSAEGAKRVEGRWHRKGHEVIYASEYFSTAMLEILAHRNGNMPSNQHYIEVTIPQSVSYEIVTKDSLPAWTNSEQARSFGVEWYETLRSCILIVPSFVARMERNFVINTKHADFRLVQPGLEHPITWDTRLFAQP